MIPVRNKKQVLTPEQEKYIVENYNGRNGKQLAQRFGITYHYLGVVKAKYKLAEAYPGRSRRWDYETPGRKVINIGRNGIFNVHAVSENWISG